MRLFVMEIETCALLCLMKRKKVVVHCPDDTAARHLIFQRFPKWEIILLHQVDDVKLIAPEDLK